MVKINDITVTISNDTEGIIDSSNNLEFSSFSKRKINQLLGVLPKWQNQSPIGLILVTLLSFS